MPKKTKSFRLDSLSTSRLETMSKQAQISQTALLEYLISACFDEYWDGYKRNEEKETIKGFDRFVWSMHDRVKINEKEGSFS